MVYIVHLSVLLILIGALVGSLVGIKGFMSINEGETVGTLALATGDETKELPFQVRCDDFSVTFYDKGQPKEFRSELTVLEGGREVHKQSIVVNDPMTWQGFTFYQSTYGTALRKAELQLKDLDTGKTQNITLPFREMVPIPESNDQIQVVQYQQDLRGFGPALGIMVTKPGKEPSGSWIIANMPEFHGNRVENYNIRIISADPVYFTGLQVKKDPGVWVVYIGFMAMLLASGLAYYTSHRKLYFWASESGSAAQKGTRVIVAGRTSKSSLAFEREFIELCDQLKNQLQPAGKRK
jgi:cytochrome c biogenesis protein